MWEECAKMETTRPARGTRRLAVLAGAGAVLALLVLLCSIGPWQDGKHSPTAKPEARPIEPRTPADDVPEDALRQIDDVRSGLLALVEDLDRLSREAALMEERAEVAALLQRCEEL